KSKDEGGRMKDESDPIPPSSRVPATATGPRERDIPYPSEAPLRFCGALQRFWMTRGHPSEGLEWCVRALEKGNAKGRTQERARALNSAGALAYLQGDYVSSRSHYQQSLEIQRESGNASASANSLMNLGILAWMQGDYASARSLYEQSLEIQRQLGDRLG